MVHGCHERPEKKATNGKYKSYKNPKPRGKTAKKTVKKENRRQG
jgi:hypothetical protein